LHLKIRKIGDDWYCSEIYTKQSYGYGEYRFYVSSNVENYDQYIVVGLFTYETDTKEIDIEFSKWGDPNRVNMGQYVIQPHYVAGNIERFDLNLTGNYSTHKFIWHQDDIFFQSYYGHYPDLPSQDYLIHEWLYNGDDNPPAGNERLHINFWLQNGNPPADNKDAELIISSVNFTPQQAPLSVMLNKFTGAVINNMVTLNWTTMSEINNSYWNIYRSPSQNFGQAIILNEEKIQGQGTTSDATNYTYHDDFINNNKLYFYWIESINYSGNSVLFGPISVLIEEHEHNTPPLNITSGLYQNYPNPFNPTTTISYQINQSGKVALSIYNIKGEKIKTLINEFKQTGKHAVVWNGKDNNGKTVSSGVYFYKLSINGKSKAIKKCLLLK